MQISIKYITNELERLCRNKMSINNAFDLLESSAKSTIDVLIINIMRDSFHEIILEEQGN